MTRRFGQGRRIGERGHIEKRAALIEILRSCSKGATPAKNLSVVAENDICYGAGRMILFQVAAGTKKVGRNLTIVACALTLVACAPMEEPDNVTGSRLAQPPAGIPPQKPTESGDIAIVGQEVAHSIMDLPAVSGASVPPLVQFTGVTSIVNPPIDTDPYTELLRDRLLLLTREKLRFVERTLPAYVPTAKKGKKKAAAQTQPVQNLTNPDYEILAELRGHADADFYKIQVEFVDVRSHEVLFNGLYRIRKEANVGPAPEAAPEASPEPRRESTGEPPPPPTHNIDSPTTTSPTSSGNESL
jgi:hypothetical protein